MAILLIVLWQRYNSLPDDGDQRQVSEAHLQDILRLILANGVEDKFGVHLIHGHLQLGKGEVMFGKPLTSRDVRGVWTRPTTDLDLNNVHGHIFTLNLDGQFTAYEYHEGPLPVMNPNDNIFVSQFGAFLQNHGLADLLGLQVLAGHGVKKMQEFDLSGSSSEGVVMLDAEDTKVDEVYRVTGWSVKTDKSTGVTELKGNDVHSAMQNGNHKIFQDSKLTDEKSLLKVLKRENVID